MKCFGECPPDCDLECGYADQFHPRVAAPPTHREWLLTAALLVLGLVLSVFNG